MKQARKARGQKKPLYRKVNSKARGACHGNGGEYSTNRNTKDVESNPHLNSSMKSHHRHGLDYTPLFKFLLKNVGEDWDSIYSEASSRLIEKDPIFFMVSTNPADNRPYFISGESSYFSGLFVDEDNKLAIVAPQLTPSTMLPDCACCTHTLNGILLSRPYEEDAYQKNQTFIDEGGLSK